MAGILSANTARTLNQKLKRQNRRIVLAGGCFDILHPGHVVFLEKAKKAGDILIVLLESDQTVRALKGSNRPIHSQKDRAKVLSALRAVDYVILLPVMKSNQAYDQLISQIKPDIIAAIIKDSNIAYYQRAAKAVRAQLKLVRRLGNHSTSSLASSIAVQYQDL